MTTTPAEIRDEFATYLVVDDRDEIVFDTENRMQAGAVKSSMQRRQGRRFRVVHRDHLAWD